jgi:hypothetical protein
MRSLARLVLVAVMAGPVLSACSSFDLDSLGEIWDSKKKLAGERKPVFPDGVPGVTSGVPPELVRGYREPEGGTVDPAKAAAEAAAETDTKPKKPPPQRTAAVKPKPKPKPADAPATAAQQQPTQGASQQPWTAQQQQPTWPGAR